MYDTKTVFGTAEHSSAGSPGATCQQMNTAPTPHMRRTQRANHTGRVSQTTLSNQTQTERKEPNADAHRMNRPPRERKTSRKEAATNAGNARSTPARSSSPSHRSSTTPRRETHGAPGSGGTHPKGRWRRRLAQLRRRRGANQAQRADTGLEENAQNSTSSPSQHNRRDTHCHSERAGAATHRQGRRRLARPAALLRPRRGTDSATRRMCSRMNAHGATKTHQTTQCAAQHPTRRSAESPSGHGAR